jgi:predicted esterase
VNIELSADFSAGSPMSLLLSILSGCADPAPAEGRVGCDGAGLRELEPDPAARGPWDVGARTVEVGRLTVEVWYPAPPGAGDGQPALDYDLRYALPESQRPLIDDARAPRHPCDCSRDLPLDSDFGPYPVVIFLHGTAAWRSQSLTEVTHWASRGFVVLAADHPGLWLADTLAILCPDEPTGEYDVPGDVDAMLAALAEPSSELAFLQGAIDLERVALVGHSAGGSAAATLSSRPGVQVVIAMAAGTPTPEGPLSTLFLGGLQDGVVPYPAVVDGYEASAGPKRLVGLDRAGHLAFSDICELENDAGQDILTIAQEVGLCGASAAGLLFDCDPAFLEPATAHAIVGASTTAALEEALHCAPPVFDGLAERYPDIAELRAEP